MHAYYELHVEYHGKTIHIEEHNDLGNAISHFRDLCYNWAMRDFHVYAYVIRPAINYKLELKHFTI